MDGWQGNASAQLAAGSAVLTFAQALVWISLSYSGFNAAVYLAGEARSPGDVAKSLVTGTLIVTLFYLLLIGLFVLVPPSEVVAGEADIAALAAGWIGGGDFERFVRFVISLALMTSVLSMMMAGPRVYGKMAEDGLLPKGFAIQSNRVWPAVLLQLGLTLFLIVFGSLQDLLGYLGLTLSLCASASVLCLFFKRNRISIKGWKVLPPLIFVCVSLISAGLLMIRDPWQALGVVVTFVAGAGGFYFQKKN